MDSVILVDEHNAPRGQMEKLEAHQRGELHRAFSICVFNAAGELMLQRRALHKYHSPGLWTNTVCSHPRPGERYEQAIHRRLQEEMGFDCELREAFSFIYRSEFDNGLIEHEHDTVFVGEYEGEPQPNLDEVAEWKWVSLDDLTAELALHPERYTEWFKIIFPRIQNLR